MTRFATLLIALAATLGTAMPAAAQGSEIYGVWKNPKNSVHVEVRPCGDQACGVVVWASEKARADAREGGGKELVGLQIFREMARAADGWWKGKVFVPDLNRTFSGQALVVADGKLKARGCLAGVICKSQTWTRAG